MDVNFKNFYNTDALSLNTDEKKALKIGANTGSEHHKTVGRLMGSGLNRKKQYFVGKTHTEKKHEHPKITLCLNKRNSKQGISLTYPEAMEIIQKYNVCPTMQETSKAIKQTGVYLILISPKVYILKYKGV
jgi:hypothetical protein